MKLSVPRVATIAMVVLLMTQPALASTPRGERLRNGLEAASAESDTEVREPDKESSQDGETTESSELAYVPSGSVTGFFAARDNRNLDPGEYNLVGGHQSFYWDQLEPTEGNFDWGPIDSFVGQMAAKGKAAAFGIITFNGRANWGNPYDPAIRTPDFVFAQGAGKVVCPDGFEIPRYWNSVYQTKYRAFVNALAARYDGDSRIEYIQIGVGKFGESQPCDDGDNSHVVAALQADGHSEWTWPYIVNDIVDIYADAFDSTHLLLPNAPRFMHECDRREFTDHAISRGVGLFPAGLTADQEWVDHRTNPSNWDGCGKYDRILDQADAGNVTPWVPVSYEMYEYMTPDITSFYWAVLAALSRHVDYVSAERDVLYEGEANDPSVTPKTDNIAVMGWANAYLGRRVDDTPSAWVALRETGYADNWYAQRGNYEFWLEQDDSISQGRTVVATYRPTSELVRSSYWDTYGASAVRPGIDTQAPLGWYKEGWITRRTDQGTSNPYMWFKIDDRYVMGGPTDATITVTYFDTGYDSWQLEYDASGNAYKVAGTINKTNTASWKKAVFSVSDAWFGNMQLGGADLRINCMGDGDEYIHLVDVQVGESPGQSQNIYLTVANDGWNFVSFALIPPSASISDVLSSISGKYDLVQAFVNGAWVSYTPGYGGDLTTVDRTMGLWIHVTQGTTLTVAGQVPSSTVIHLSAANGGWNLIGWPSASSVSASSALAGISGCYDIVHTFDAFDAADPWKVYNPAAPSYASDLEQFVPGRALWVHVVTDCDLTVAY